MRHSTAKQTIKVENLGKNMGVGELTHIQVTAYYHKPEYLDGKRQGFYIDVSPVRICPMNGYDLISYSSEPHPFNKLFLIKEAKRDNKRYTEKLVESFIEDFSKEPTVECMHCIVERLRAE